MKIAAITGGGIFAVDVDVRGGVFTTAERVDVAFEDGAFLRVPDGFVFDGASIPGELRSFIPSLTVAGYVAFVLHDYAYALGARYIAPNGNRLPISRQRADWIALALCEWLGLPCVQSLKIYSALRAAGGFAFRRRRIDASGDDVRRV